MIERLFKDESGMTMGLAVIMIVLIGVMGAGLLTFVSTDLNAVVEVNQGQKALEVADAGVQAAKQQLITDGAPRIHYDGGVDDVAWSYCYGVTGCSSASPSSTGSAGMTVNVDGNTAKVTIISVVWSPGTYKVVSEGQVGVARRKIEALLRHDADIDIPAAYFTRGNITLTGSADPVGVSFFGLGNVDVGGNVNWGTANDAYFGAWAATSGTGPYPNVLGSYPNGYNTTARGSALPGVGVLGTITGTNAQIARGIRSYDATTVPRMRSDFSADGVAGQQSTEIGFPFEVPTPAEDKEEIEILRQRALAQETPSKPLYIDSNPGNGVDDPGLPNGSKDIDLWPSGSDYQTVVFYKYAAYNSANRVSYKAGASSCGTTTNKGVIVVENGDMQFNSNKRFDGGIIVRAYDSSGNLLPTSGGLYNASGTPCLYGYVNTSGGMTVTGTMNPGTAPELGSLSTFRGSMEQISWRELYQ